MSLEDVIREFQLVPPVDHATLPERAVAPRLDAEGQHRLALLDNRKGNARELLAYLGESLTADYGFTATTAFVKPIFSRPAPGEIIDKVQRFNAVITGIGD